MFLGRHKGPVLGVFSAFLHPLREQFALGGSKLLFGILRRHRILGIMQARENFALAGLLGIDSGVPAQITRGAGKRIKPHKVLLFGVRPVAHETFVGKDGQDLARKIHRECRRGASHGHCQKTNTFHTQKCKATSGDCHVFVEPVSRLIPLLQITHVIILGQRRDLVGFGSLIPALAIARPRAGHLANPLLSTRLNTM